MKVAAQSVLGRYSRSPVTTRQRSIAVCGLLLPGRAHDDRLCPLRNSSSRATPALDIAESSYSMSKSVSQPMYRVQIKNYYKTCSFFYERFFLVRSLFDCFCSYFIPSPFLLFKILVTIIITLES